MLIIHREGDLSREKAVRITQVGDRRMPIHPNRLFVNPATEIWHATGVTVNRNDCICSLADGLVVAGHDVLMDYTCVNRPHATFRHRRRDRTTSVFFLFGLAWGTSQWTQMQKTLQRFVPIGSLRLTVLEQTGSYYWEHAPNPRDGLRLQIQIA